MKNHTHQQEEFIGLRDEFTSLPFKNMLVQKSMHTNPLEYMFTNFNANLGTLTAVDIAEMQVRFDITFFDGELSNLFWRPKMRYLKSTSESGNNSLSLPRSKYSRHASQNTLKIVGSIMHKNVVLSFCTHQRPMCYHRQLCLEHLASAHNQR